jgi:hypothetical protein
MKGVRPPPSKRCGAPCFTTPYHDPTGKRCIKMHPTPALTSEYRSPPRGARYDFAMPRPSRIRRVAKWIGVVVSALLGGAWAVSTCGGIVYDRGRAWYGVELGGVEVTTPVSGYSRYKREPCWYVYRAAPEVYWLPFWISRPTSTEVLVPLWVLLAVVAFPTGCGGRGPTSYRRAHSRPPADPADLDAVRSVRRLLWDEQP